LPNSKLIPRHDQAALISPGPHPFEFSEVVGCSIQQFAVLISDTLEPDKSSKCGVVAAMESGVLQADKQIPDTEQVLKARGLSGSGECPIC
jgi:hypothetical protein